MYKLTGILLLFLVMSVAAEEDTVSTGNIVYFTEPFALNAFGAFGITGFFQDREVGYQAQNPWALGLGLRYKKISVKISLPPFYALDDKPLETYNVQVNSYHNAIYYEAFLKNYRKFSIVDSDNATIDLNLFSAGISAGWTLNNTNHSLSAVYNLDGRQLSPSGSFLFGLGVFYTSLYSGDGSVKHYADKQRFLYFGPQVGYSYTFVFPYNMFFNIKLAIGLNTGINTNENKWLFVPQVMPKLSLGHHGNSWSISFIGDCNGIIILWDKNNFDNILLSNMTIVFSKRLSPYNSSSTHKNR